MRSGAPTTLWPSEIDSTDVVLSLACSPKDVEISSIIYSEKIASVSRPASPDLGRQEQNATDEAQERTMNEAMRHGYSTEQKQEVEVGSVMMEEVTSSVMGVSENGRRSELEAVPFKEWHSMRSMEKYHPDLEITRSGISVVLGSF